MKQRRVAQRSLNYSKYYTTNLLKLMCNNANVGDFAMDSNPQIKDLLHLSKQLVHHSEQCSTLGTQVILAAMQLIASSTQSSSSPTGEPSKEKEWETREEALARYKISNPTLNKWVRNGKITCKHVGSKPYYSVDSFYKNLTNQG